MATTAEGSCRIDAELHKDGVHDVSEFIDAVERVSSGGTAFDPEVVRSLVDGRRRLALDELTDPERAVLALVAEGRSNRAIAKQMFISPRAIERHLQAIFTKLALPESEDDSPRALALLALLGRQTPQHDQALDLGTGAPSPTNPTRDAAAWRETAERSPQKRHDATASYLSASVCRT